MEASSTDKKKAEESAPIASTINYVKDIFLSGSQSASGKNIEMGVSALLAKTALRRLPPPLNYVVPLVVKNVIVKHGVPEGRELLLKGLRWVKKNTEEKPVNIA
jgi:hypothetical protein